MKDERMLGLKKFLKDESGATAIEYGLIALAICLVVVVGVRQVGTNLQDGAYADIARIFQ